MNCFHWLTHTQIIIQPKVIRVLGIQHLCHASGPVLKDAEDSPDVHDAGFLVITEWRCCTMLALLPWFTSEKFLHICQKVLCGNTIGHCGEVSWWSISACFCSPFSQSQLESLLGQRMVDGALHIVEPWEGGTPELWDLALECKAWWAEVGKITHPASNEFFLFQVLPHSFKSHHLIM